MRDLVDDGLVDGVHDVSDGGLGLALAEMAVRSGTGFDVDVDGGHAGAVLRGALPGRRLRAAGPHVAEVTRRAAAAGVPSAPLGHGRRRPAGGGRAGRPLPGRRRGHVDRRPSAEASADRHLTVIRRSPAAPSGLEWARPSRTGVGVRWPFPPKNGGDDGVLVLAVQRGDGDAFAELFRRHYSAVRRACSRRLFDAHEADEVTQAAFVRAFERIDQCAGERRFGPWVQVIARSLCMDAFRAQARVEPREEPLAGRRDHRPNEPEESLLHARAGRPGAARRSHDPARPAAPGGHRPGLGGACGPARSPTGSGCRSARWTRSCCGPGGRLAGCRTAASPASWSRADLLE